MKNFRINKNDNFAISLILLLAFSRMIPHPPNFTPIIAVAIMSGYFFKNLNLSLFVLVISMILSDIFIGFYNNLIFVYSPLILITIIFFKISNMINLKNLFLLSFLGSLIFYLISNFGVWAAGNLYEKNLNGLIECYLLAIPFFKNTILSTLIFSYSAYLANYFYEKTKIKRN
tara:strand:+ start:2235 stop:2753 length:519 start_codon:yes stop_codon:yes gene_type:complete